MPNVLELTEVVSALAKSAMPEARLLEELGPRLSLEATQLLERTGAVTSETGGIPAVVRRFLGQAPGASKELVMIGKPLRSDLGHDVDLAIYSKGKNIYLHGDGHLSIVSPTPTGNVAKIETLSATGQPGKIDYSPILEDEYPSLKNPFKSGDKAILHVRTTGHSREVEVGYQNVREPENFAPTETLLNQIRKSAAVDLSPVKIQQHIGDLLAGPGEHYVAGFDSSSGEALLGSKGLTYKGPLFGTQPRIVRSLQGFHSVPVQASDGLKFNAVRDASGKLFQVDRLNKGFRLNPTEMMRAGQPSEVVLANGRTLAQELNLPTSVGLRAQGGYSTELGSRLAL